MATTLGELSAIASRLRWTNGVLDVLGRALVHSSGGIDRLIRYIFIAQSVPERPGTPPPRRRGTWSASSDPRIRSSRSLRIAFIGAVRFVHLSLSPVSRPDIGLRPPEN